MEASKLVDADRKAVSGIPLASSQYNLYDIYLLLCVQYCTLDAGQKTCPKHVELYSKNKFEKLVHLFGFIVKIIIECWT